MACSKKYDAVFKTRWSAAVSTAIERGISPEDKIAIRDIYKELFLQDA